MNDVIKNNKKRIFGSLITILVLIIVLVIVCIERKSNIIPDLYATIDNSKYIKCEIGNYEWQISQGIFFTSIVTADSIAPLQRKYTEDNTLHTKSNEKIFLSNSNQLNKSDKFSVEKIVYHKKDINLDTGYNYEGIEVDLKQPYIIALESQGEYIYVVTLKYKKGICEYSFKVIVE